MTKKSSGWNLQEMQETLVKDTEQSIEQGFKEIASTPSVPSGSAASVESVAVQQQPSEQEPTKGVQTYIPISQYRRLNDIKLTRRENIATLVAQAIELWLDVQEGKQKVEKVI
jgi:hypothetical protein